MCVRTVIHHKFCKINEDTYHTFCNVKQDN